MMNRPAQARTRARLGAVACWRIATFLLLGSVGSGASAQTTASGEDRPFGLHAEIGYTVDVLGAARGGRSGTATYFDNVDLMLSADLEELFGTGKSTLRAHVQSNRGSSPSMAVGDFQGLSNIEAPTNWRLYELWIEHNLIPGRVSLLGGIYDLNAEFDVVPVAGDFVNSSFGFGPDYSATGLAGPSTFPLTSVAIRVKARPVDRVYVQLSVADGAPGDPAVPTRSRFALGRNEGALISWEIGYRRTAPGVPVVLDEPPTRVQDGGRRIGRGRLSERLRTKMALGGWVYTRDFDRWDGGGMGASRGAYVLGEQLVLGGDDRALSVFGRGGLASAAVNQLSAYVGAGLVVTGAIAGRANDVVGVGVALARNGSPFLDAQVEALSNRDRAETAVEVFYSLQINDAIRLQPDVQWILSPGMRPSLANAMVLGVRGMITWSSN